MNATRHPTCPACGGGEPPAAVVLLTPAEADELLRYPRGRSARLARRGLLPSVELPDGELRFPADLLEQVRRGHAVARPDGPNRPTMRLVPAPENDGRGDAAAAAEGGTRAR